MKSRRKSRAAVPQGSHGTELLVIHEALEGWIHRQHVITREIVQTETAKLRREIAALRRDVLARARTR
jgi:hypothetical protein